jgi:hypothetical protein
MSIGAQAGIEEFYLEPSGNSENPVTTYQFDTPLTTDEAWTITATTRYYGVPSNATWGSRLFHAYRLETPWKSGVAGEGEFTDENHLCFYMRPTIGGADEGARGKMLLNNRAFTDVLIIDEVNGTLFTFEIVSDGSGSLLVNMFVEGNNNGAPYTKTYSESDLTGKSGTVTGLDGTIYGLAAGSNYEVEGTIDTGAPIPQIAKPADVNFRWVLKDKTAIKPLTVKGFNLTGNITGTVSGTDATAFSVPTASAASDGNLEIAFAPTETRVYNAKLVLTAEGAEPVEINLKGEGIDALPIVENEWYYVQFARRAGESKVWTATTEGDSIAQSVLTPGNDLQLWKVSGDWDEYYFTNKSLGTEASYDIEKDRYLTVVSGTSDEIFGFVRYKDTPTWQVQNLIRTLKDPTTGEDVPSKNYINDHQGKAVCAYSIDDAGNQLTFIPATESKLLVGIDSIGFGKYAVGYTSTKKQAVVALNLPAFTYAVSGAGEEAFAVTKPAADSLLIAFTPQDNLEYNALLTITAGSQSHTIKLVGTGVKVPVRISDATNEYWYQIQCNRKADKAFKDYGIGEKIMQTDTTGADDTYLWKITGSWDKYKIVAKSSGNEFKYDADLSRYISVASGEGNIFRLDANADGQWGIYNMTLTSGNRYINDFGGSNSTGELGHYSFDEGSVINFLPTFANISAPNVLSFYEIEQGASFTKAFTVSSRLLTGAISYSLTGADAAAFTVTVVEEEEAAALTPGTLYQEGGTLRVTFTPTDKKAYRAKLVLSATGAETQEITLSGTADFTLPVSISTETAEEWYYIQFEKNSNVLTYDEIDWVAQATKATGDEKQLWKFTGTPTEGYQVVNKAAGKAITFAADLNEEGLYELTESGDSHQFIRANDGVKWQLYNRSTDADYRYLNDFYAQGKYVGLYSGNDTGNYLTFISAKGTAIQTPEAVSDAVVATRYYTLQGIEVKKPAQNGIYIKQDFYASKRVKATKVYYLIK